MRRASWCLTGNSVLAANAALELAHSLTPKDTLIFLVSGGGSALFESPLVSLEELQDVNRQLLASGRRYNRNEYLRGQAPPQ